VQGSSLYLQDNTLKDESIQKTICLSLNRKMKNTIKPFSLNVDFNKLEKYTCKQKQDDHKGIYFKIKIRQT
jgi:uncharacterized Fe-S cluster-containing MiaB family protein